MKVLICYHSDDADTYDVFIFEDIKCLGIMIWFVILHHNVELHVRNHYVMY